MCLTLQEEFFLDPFSGIYCTVIALKKEEGSNKYLFHLQKK